MAIRRRLSPFEQNVLIFGARGGAAMIRAEVPSIRSVEEAEAALGRVKEKVAKLVEDARKPEESNGHRPQGPVVDPDVPQRERGAMLERVPMPTMPRPRPRRGPKRKKGELLREALKVLAEEGPMRQSELRVRLGIEAPEMSSNLKPQLLRAGVTEGEVVDRSPVLSYAPPEGAQLPDGPSELQTATEPPPVPPPAGIEPMLPQLGPGPPVNGELAEFAKRVRDAVVELTAATDALLARLGER